MLLREELLYKTTFTSYASMYVMLTYISCSYIHMYVCIYRICSFMNNLECKKYSCISSSTINFIINVRHRKKNKQKKTNATFIYIL